MYPWHDCLEVIRSSIPHCWTRWRVGASLMNLKTLICPSKNTKTQPDEESMNNTCNISTDHWPRFLIIEPISEGTINSLSPKLSWWAEQCEKIQNGRLLVNKWSLNNTILSPFSNQTLCAIYPLRLVHTCPLILQKASFYRGIKESVKMRCLKISLLKEC